MKKVLIIALVCLGTLGLAISVFLLTRPKVVSMERMFPAGASSYIRISHAQENFQKFTQSELGKSLSSINLPQVLERNGFSSHDIKNLKNIHEEVRDFLENPVARKLISQEIAFGIYPKQREVLFATRLDLSLQIAQVMISMARKWSDDIVTSSEDYHGSKIFHVQFKKKRISIEYVRIHDVLFVAFSPTELLHQAIDVSLKNRPSLESNPDFVKSIPHLYAQGQGVVYVRISDLFHLFKEHIPIKEKLVIDGFLEEGRGLGSYVLSFLPGDTLKTKMLVSFETSRLKGQLKDWLSCTGSKNSSLKFIPHNVEVYHWGSCFDFNTMLSSLKDRTDDEQGKNEENLVSRSIRKTFKLALRKDILPLLGPEAGWYLNDVDMQGAFPYPRAVAFVKITNRPNVENIIDQVTQKFSSMMKQEEYQKNLIHYISLPLGSNMDPAYMFLDHYLLVGSSRELLKSSADAFMNPNQSISSSGNLKKLNLDETVDSQGIVYIKIKEIVGHALKVLTWYNKMKAAQIDGSLAVEEGVKEQDKTLDVDYDSRKEELSLAQSTLKKLKVRGLTELTLEEKTENQSNIEHMLDDIKDLEAQQASYKIQKEGLRQALINYHSQVDSAKLWLYNFDAIVKPLLKSFEGLDEMGIRSQINGQMSEMEFLIK